MRRHRTSASPLVSVSPMAASPEKTLPSQIHLALGHFSQFFLLSVWQVGEQGARVAHLSLYSEESNSEPTVTNRKNLNCVERRSI